MADRLSESGAPGLLDGPWQEGQPLVDQALSGDTAPLAIVGNAASAFTWSDAATGLETFTGPVASSFGWSDALSGTQTFSGAAASSFLWSDLAVGIRTVAASTGGARGRRRLGFFHPIGVRMPRQISIGRVDSGFAFGARAVAAYSPAPIGGGGTSRFGWSSSADDLVAFEDDLFLGLDEEGFFFGI